MKILLIKYDYFDFFNVIMSIFFVLFSFLYIRGGYKILIVIIIVISISIVLNSFLKYDSKDSFLIISNGVINFKKIYKSNYDFISLINDFKKNGISSIDDNICAILKNGKVSFYIKKNSLNDFFIPIVKDGYLNIKLLKYINKNKIWFDRFLYKNKCSLKDIKLLLYHKNTFYIIKKIND